MKRIYVGNLPYTTSESELQDLFSAHGAVHGVNVVMDRVTGRSRGFAFVDMDDEAAANAISALDGTQLGGRSLRVNEARERGGPRRDFNERREY